MNIMDSKKIYPRTGDQETVYLKSVIKNPSIIVGDYTMYNDFVNDPTLFEKNNVLSLNEQIHNMHKNSPNLSSE